MRIVLDENLPRLLLTFFGSEHQVVTVQDLGFSGISNGELIARLDGKYEVLLTADKNLRYQQNLDRFSLAVVELPTNRLPVLRQLADEIVLAVTTAPAQSYVRVAPPQVLDHPT